jgi:hypothetical protein
MSSITLSQLQTETPFPVLLNKKKYYFHSDPYSINFIVKCAHMRDLYFSAFPFNFHTHIYSQNKDQRDLFIFILIILQTSRKILKIKRKGQFPVGKGTFSLAFTKVSSCAQIRAIISNFSLSRDHMLCPTYEGATFSVRRDIPDKHKQINKHVIFFTNAFFRS